MKLRTRRNPAAPTNPRPVQTPTAPFGEVFEKEFRQRPLVIASSLILSGFVAGFSTRSVLPDDDHNDAAMLCLIAQMQKGTGPQAAGTGADKGPGR